MGHDALVVPGSGLAVRVARGLYSRWRVLSPPERDRLSGPADAVRQAALDLRGSPDPGEAERDLREAGQALAAGLVDTAEADPEVDEIEVRRLRDELARELDRLASADVRASRAAPRDRSP